MVTIARTALFCLSQFVIAQASDPGHKGKMYIDCGPPGVPWFNGSEMTLTCRVPVFIFNTYCLPNTEYSNALQFRLNISGECEVLNITECSPRDSPNPCRCVKQDSRDYVVEYTFTVVHYQSGRWDCSIHCCERMFFPVITEGVCNATVVPTADPCGSNPCHNKGVCSPVAGSGSWNAYNCSCPPGWIDNTCSTNILPGLGPDPGAIASGVVGVVAFAAALSAVVAVVLIKRKKSGATRSEQEEHSLSHIDNQTDEAESPARTPQDPSSTKVLESARDESEGGTQSDTD